MDTDKVFGTIQYTIESLPLPGLQVAAKTIVVATDQGLSEPFKNYSKEELRKTLLECVEKLRQEHPERLAGIHSALDSIARSELMRLLEARRSRRGKQGAVTKSEISYVQYGILVFLTVGTVIVTFDAIAEFRQAPHRVWLAVALVASTLAFLLTQRKRLSG